MIKKTQRLPLTSHDSFRGSRLRGPLFDLIIAPSNHPPYRLACIIGKKVSLQAVRRNLIKRRLIHALKPILAAHGPLDCLVIVHPPAAQATSADLLKNLNQLINRLTD